jgi:TRAP-type C4-dicarboxylate transport system permease small subunit
VRLLRRIDQQLGRVEHLVLVICLVTLIGVGTYQAIASNLFDQNPTWSFELIRFAVFFIAMAGAALATQCRRLINMDVLTRSLPARPRAWAGVVVQLFTLLMCAALVAGGLVSRQTTMDETQFEFIRPAVGVLALPAGAALIGLHILIHLLLDLHYLVRGQLPPGADAGQPQLH